MKNLTNVGFRPDFLVENFDIHAQKFSEEEIQGMTDEDIKEILKEDGDLYYIMTKADFQWYEMVYNRYAIADFIGENSKGLKGGVVLRITPDLVKKAMKEDSVTTAIPMLSKDSTLFRVLMIAFQL